jgi:hypothetical protein
MTREKMRENMHRRDCVYVGTVDRVRSDRIKLKKRDSDHGINQRQHRCIEIGFVAGIEEDKSSDPCHINDPIPNGGIRSLHWSAKARSHNGGLPRPGRFQGMGV